MRMDDWSEAIQRFTRDKIGNSGEQKKLIRMFRLVKIPYHNSIHIAEKGKPMSNSFAQNSSSAKRILPLITKCNQLYRAAEMMIKRKPTKPAEDVYGSIV